jgi:hypothetical protein
MNKYTQAILDGKLPPPKGYIGERFFRHSIPFLNWSKYPGLYNKLFVQKTSQKLNGIFYSKRIDKNKKTIVIILEDACEPVLGMDQDILLSQLKTDYNVVLIYIYEFIHNIKQTNDNIIKIGPLTNNIYNEVEAHLKLLITEYNIEACLVFEPIIYAVLLLWKYKLPIVSIFSKNYYTAKELYNIERCFGYSDFNILNSSLASNEKVLHIIKNKTKHFYPDKSNFFNSIDTSFERIKKFKKVLEEIGNFIKESIKTENIYARTISQSTFFNIDSFPLLENLSKQEVAKQYLRISKAAVEPRKPCAGFNPDIYLQSNLNIEVEPFVDFINKGCPQGCWMNNVISPITRKYPPYHKTIDRVALHIHAHYPDDIKNVICRIKQNRLKPDIYITTSSIQSEQLIKKQMSISGLEYKKISILPNRGRNIGPFLTGIIPFIKEKYSIIGHVHLKKSTHSGAQAVMEWNRFLMENLIGGKHRMMDQICSSMFDDEAIGITYPDDPNIYDWGQNYSFAYDLSKKMNISIPASHEKFSFPAGAMFWIRPKAILPLINLNLGWNDYPEEPVHVDGTMLHAIERLFGIIPEKVGYSTLLTQVPSVSRTFSLHQH